MARRQYRQAYRDRLTGRFVGRAEWKRGARARAAGRKRFVKERVKIGKKAPPPPPPVGPVKTWFIMFMYAGTSGAREVDFFVRARTDEGAYKAVTDFMAADPRNWQWALGMLAMDFWTEVISRPFDPEQDEIEPEELADLEKKPEGYVESR